MVIGLLRVRLHLPLCHSLKEKRSIIKRIIHRLRTGYNCAIAETGLHDVWQSSEIAIVTVYNEKSAVESLLQKIEKILMSQDDFEVTECESEFL